MGCKKNVIFMPYNHKINTCTHQNLMMSPIVCESTQVSGGLSVGKWLMLLILMFVASLTPINAQCVGVYTPDELRSAIQSANLYNNSVPTVITLCSDFNVTPPGLIWIDNFGYTSFDVTYRNIHLQCNKTQTGATFALRQARCIFDGKNNPWNMFHGVRTKISFFRTNFINFGALSYPGNFANALNFRGSAVELHQCSFLNNFGGEAVLHIVSGSNLTIRGGTRFSQNLFYNNVGSAIRFSGHVFKIKGQHTNFTRNIGPVGSSIYISAFTDFYNPARINISGTTFLENESNSQYVRTIGSQFFIPPVTISYDRMYFFLRFKIISWHHNIF
jgi:hypothetical protein